MAQLPKPGMNRADNMLPPVCELPEPFEAPLYGGRPEMENAWDKRTESDVESASGNTETDSFRVGDKQACYTHYMLTWFPEDCQDEKKCVALIDKVMSDAKSLKNLKYFVGQCERTKSGKIHVQFCIGFTRSERILSKASKLWPGCHVETSRKWWNSQSYCCKEDSRVPFTTRLWGCKIDDIKPWGSVEQVIDKSKATVGKKRSDEVVKWDFKSNIKFDLSSIYAEYEVTREENRAFMDAVRTRFG